MSDCDLPGESDGRLFFIFLLPSLDLRNRPWQAIDPHLRTLKADIGLLTQENETDRVSMHATGVINARIQLVKEGSTISRPLNTYLYQLLENLSIKVVQSLGNDPFQSTLTRNTYTARFKVLIYPAIYTHMYHPLLGTKN